MKILWCVTGAGHFLEESFSAMRKISDDNITLALSGAGFEVVRMYGLLETMEDLSGEVILEDEQGFSSPVVGRLADSEYSKVIVSPCTTNTVAKIVNGISDSLVTNIVAQAMKSRVPVIIVPTDLGKKQKTRIPINIRVDRCRDCECCPPMGACPTEAIYRNDRVRVDMLRCNACLACVELCEHDAIIFGGGAIVNIRDIDAANVKKLKAMEGVKVVKSPRKITS